MTVRPFITPLNERSFSGLVDRAVIETGKTQALLAAIQYANLTIRECQVLGLFAQDMIEDQVIATSAPFQWTRPRYFRSLRVVQYDTSKCYPKYRMPGRGKNDTSLREFFYAADNYFMFNGVMQDEGINMAVYYFAKPLVYNAILGLSTVAFPGGPYNVREALFNTLNDTWYYLNDTDDGYVVSLGDEVEELARRNNAANWLIIDWFDLILEGVKAKIFKQFGDDRAAISFSLYKQAQKNLQITTGTEAESFNLVD